ncbi:MAG: RHS repeat-associated core domain-containing protein [Pyrinomonadaceae bacterium]
MPFGEELYADGTYRTTAANYSTTGFDPVRQRFTGYQRDEETSLDFAEARYYKNSHGRFTAVDPLLASGQSANPQTFNRYVYVQNNPLILVDPTGLQAGTAENEVFLRIQSIPAWIREITEPIRQRVARLMNDVSSSDPLQNANYSRFQERLDGYPDGPGRRLVGNQGPTVDSVLQQTTESFRAAQTIGETSLLIQGGVSFAQGFVPRGAPNITSNLGGRLPRAPSIATPYGPAYQDSSDEAMAARSAVSSGARLYRRGTLGESSGPEAQFWSLEHPASAGFAGRYGLSGSSTKYNFFQSGKIKQGQSFVTRAAPKLDGNPGGGIEVVTNPCGVRICSFSTLNR